MADNYKILVSKEIKQIAWNICHQKEKHLYEDLHQESILYILEKGYNLNELPSDELPYLFSKIAWYIYNNTSSKNSFKKRHSLNELRITKDIKQDDNNNEIEEKIKSDKSLEAIELKLFSVSESTDDEYNKGLFHCYLKYGSGYAVSTMTGIPARTVYQDLADYKKELKLIYEAANKE